MIHLQDNIWGNDWFLGLIVGIILFLMAQLHMLQPLEQMVYDWSVRQINRNPSDKVAVIAIDDPSLKQLGDWPWSRSIIAQMIDLLAPHAQVIGITLDFTEAQSDPGQIYIDDILTFYNHSQSLKMLPEHLEELDALINEVSQIRTRYSRDKKIVKKLNDFYKKSFDFNKLFNMLTTLEDKLQAARIELDRDQQLANSFKQANNVVLGMPFLLGKSTDISVVPNLPHYVQKHELKTIRDRFDNPHQTPQPPSGLNAIPPLKILGNSVSGIGHFNPSNLNKDSRRIPLVIKYKNSYFPSFPLLLAAKSLHLNNSQIEVRLGKGIRMRPLQINTDASLQVQPLFYRNNEAQPSLIIDSFADVLFGRIPTQKYQNKIVLLGMTANHYSAFHSTPLGQMPSILVLANTLTSLLNQAVVRVPHWGIWVQMSTFIFVIGYLGFCLPLLKQRIALMISSIILIILIIIYLSLLSYSLLVQLMLSILLVPCGHLSLQVKRGIMAYQDAFRSHPDAVESNRLLGLAFQGQGHLDLAFEKFRRCPPDEAIMGLLYNLALDYERKRQFRRAGAVYRYMSSHHPHFRDIEQRLEQLHRLRKPRLPTHHHFGDCLPEYHSEKPVLGRYQIEKPLGKGAMGVVYLGKDSKLNRLVAIKTLPLSQEFEAEELQEATIRFFREATAAGRLKHSHIVSIYDAGEEQDLAYISMEFFKGGNLVPYTQKDNLLPLPTVVTIIIQVAEALDYAYSQGVVHRDIKPANIMYNPATGQIKITDFGIARITDSNRTKTGIILGTPSYMSPEQLAGKPLDGRTDLFSLGVMLYQLLTGVLPFQADSMATLMFKIANESHPDILTVRTDVPPSLKQVVDIALQKEVSARYQSGAEFASALRDCDNLGEV